MLSPSSGAASYAANQELPKIGWNRKVDLRDQKGTPSSLSRARSIRTHLSLGFASSLFLPVFSTKTLYALLFPPCATCPANLILIGFVVLIIFLLHGLSPRMNYTDQATVACRRSDCQLLRIEDATWSA
jgi:hypothetical protein